jgi:hypothetical protein
MQEGKELYKAKTPVTIEITGVILVEMGGDPPPKFDH